MRTLRLIVALSVVLTSPITAQGPLFLLSTTVSDGYGFLMPPDDQQVYEIRPYWENRGVDVWARDPQTGELVYRATLLDDGLRSSESTVFSADGTRVYSTSRSGNRFEEDHLDTFSRSTATGALRRIDTTDAGELHYGGVSGIALDPSDRFLYLGLLRHFPFDGFSGAMFVVDLEREDSSGRPTIVQSQNDFPNLGYVKQLYLTRTANRLLTLEHDDNLIFAPDRGVVAEYDRDPETGLLTRREHWSDEGMIYPEGMVVSPDERSIYVITQTSHNNAQPDRLYSLTRDPITGTIVDAQWIDGDTPGMDALRHLRSIASSPDGNLVVVGTRTHLLVFEREHDSGALRFVQEVAVAGNDIVGQDRATVSVAFDRAGSRLFVNGRGTLQVFGVACRASGDVMCLRDQDRFKAEIEWHDRRGRFGRGSTVPLQADDSGLFWFFREDNWEVLTKVLDGCGANDHFWVFAAATTDVGYTLRVTDTWTGIGKSFDNPVGQTSPAIVDTRAFDTCAADSGPITPPNRPATTPAPVLASAGQNDCGPDRLCLHEGRFEIRVDWRDARDRTGNGQVAAPVTDKAGLFWFFREDNWELLVKVLDGCAANGHYWVLAAATTNLGYTLRIEDTQTGAARSYVNVLGDASPATIDIRALACPAP